VWLGGTGSLWAVNFLGRRFRFCVDSKSD
jgi:hypothetical protein